MRLQPMEENIAPFTNQEICKTLGTVTNIIGEKKSALEHGKCLHTSIHFQQPEESTVYNPILQMRKRRHRGLTPSDRTKL